MEVSTLNSHLIMAGRLYIKAKLIVSYIPNYGAISRRESSQQEELEAIARSLIYILRNKVFSVPLVSN